MIVSGASISECWLKALKIMVNTKVKEISPFIANIAVNQEKPEYMEELEADLNGFLLNINQPEIGTTANTIFPASLSGGNSSVFARFDKIWKYVRHDTKNRNGHYFRRLTSYGSNGLTPVNQLQHILDTYNGIDGVRSPVHRRSALIANTFDPHLDHTAASMRGFPCLQQVCFVPQKKAGTMSLNAVYAMQYLSDRAYGNYLGLKRLGEYMAINMNLELSHVNCIASVLELGKMKKSEALKIVSKFGMHV